MVCLLKGLFFCLGIVFCANNQPYFCSLFKRSCSFILLPIAIFDYHLTNTFWNKVCSKLNKRQKKAQRNAVLSLSPGSFYGVNTSLPPIYGCKASGTRTLPSAC